MTRLITSDIAHINDSLNDYEEDLRVKTGQTLKGLACNAVGVEEKKITEIFHRTQVQIVPVTWGVGLIAGFTEAVAAILNQIGLTATVTRKPNISGFMEAAENQSDLIFASDDDDFMVVNLNQKKSVHNAAATGRGFAAGLDLMAGGLQDCGTLVIGCGPVGAAAAAELMRRGARVTVYDLDSGSRRKLIEDPSLIASGEVLVTENLKDTLRQHDYVLDATPAANIIAAEMVGPETFVAAPGMPLGLTPAAIEKIGLRLLHDPLQIGVATMAVEALAESSGPKPHLRHPG